MTNKKTIIEALKAISVVSMIFISYKVISFIIVNFA